MSDDSQEAKLFLKVMVNKENNKVLFAEADTDFADVLLSFLTLPLGKIVRLVNNHYGVEAPVIGKLTNLYKCLSNLDVAYFSTEGAKQMLLDPGSSFSDECSKLKINVDDTMPATKYFRCGDVECSRTPLIVRYHDMLKCDCGEYMNKPMVMTGPESPDDGGVFMKKGLSFLITDELKMVPVVPDSIVQTLVNLGVTITDGAQLRIVSLGLNEIMDLLRASLLSTTPLTDVVFHNKMDKMDGVTGDLLRSHTIKEGSLLDSKKMIVKGAVNYFLRFDRYIFALETCEDFVDFLFSLLVIPLSGVEWLLGSNTGLSNMDNLYRSIKDCIDEKCFRTSDMKSRLMNPKLPSGCLSNIQMFPIKEEVNPKVCFFKSLATTGDGGITTNETSSWMQFKDPKGGACYVKSSGTFHVLAALDELSVSSNCKVARKFWKLYAEHKELELHIGLREALDILCSSLASSTSPIFENLFSGKAELEQVTE